LGSVGAVVVKRLNREQFFDKLAGLDEAGLKKMLWTLYWRGSASTRERIESALDPQAQDPQRRAPAAPPDAGDVLEDVTEFAGLARSGAYLAGDRRVSPKERTRWRHTFKELASRAVDAALRGDDVDGAARALATLIDVACETRGYDYFRSEDPVEAARFVVSDAAATLWSTILRKQGFTAFSERAAGQLVQWESRYGWTRRGDGWVSERETTLAHVIAGMLPGDDAWGQFTDDYLRALDRAAERQGGAGARGTTRSDRAEELSEWNSLLLERLPGGDYEDRLDTLVQHRGLAGPERTFLQAQLHERRGERDEALRLIRSSLRAVPGHPEFRAFAERIGA
jgi:hypothetical protein